MIDPAPQDLGAVLDPQWLTTALARGYPGTVVERVNPGEVISRVSTNARFHIEGQLPDDLYPYLCVKGYFSETGRPFGFLGEIEGSFYRDLAPSTGVRTLRSVYADVNPTTHHGLFITEDVVQQGGVFLDALSDYSTDQLAASLTELAKLHSSTWKRTELRSARWLDSRAAGYMQVRGVPDILANFDTEIGAGVPEGVRDAQRVYDAFGKLIDKTIDVDEWCVMHGDAHVGNLFLDGDGRPCFLDWQLVVRGPWYLDVGYHLCSALPIEVRRANERDLVRHYLSELAARGAPAPSETEAWEGIRLGIMYGFYLWAITAKVDPAITTELNTRLGTAADDHGSLEAALR